MLNATRYKLTRSRTLHFLEELKAGSVEAGSLCIPPGYSRIDIEGLLETLSDIEIPEDLSKSVAESPTGAVIFWGPHHRYAILPPFPVYDERSSKTCEIEPLSAILHRELCIGLILVRLGAYGIGVFQGDHLLTSKVGTGLVHARHRQGGSSSHRFERHREKQMETFFTRVCIHLREQLEPHAWELNYVFYGGTRETLLDFRKQCHFTQQFDKRTMDILLNIREPNQSGLHEAFEEAWSSRVIRWDE